ncbi:hypothetical protein ACPWT1_08785 [Ramlibacter sp. MMS24-I3-19]|uniref:hypothetical protein n=1 Tax=Ramlibacter sp. MMS24-I3-19 TaxID=3416606 RepID=UPI003D01F798
MSRIAYERDQLRIADRHIAAAERRVLALDTHVEEQRRLGHDVSLAERVLLAMRQSLGVLLQHRELIARMVDDLRDGAVPDC